MTRHLRSSLELMVLLSGSIGLSSCFKIAPTEDSQDTGTSTTDSHVDPDDVGDTDTDTNAPMDLDTGTHPGSNADTGGDAPEETDVDSSCEDIILQMVAVSGQCYPLCLTTTEGSDPENPDWGYEHCEIVSKLSPHPRCKYFHFN